MRPNCTSVSELHVSPSHWALQKLSDEQSLIKLGLKGFLGNLSTIPKECQIFHVTVSNVERTEFSSTYIGLMVDHNQDLFGYSSQK